MQVILLEKNKNLGNIGDKVNVKPGYARNYLLPNKKAAVANAENLAKFESIRAELEAKSAKLFAEAQERAKTFENFSIIIPARAADEIHLFGSVGVREIALALQEAGKTINRKEIILPKGPIHEIGEHEVNLQLHSDLTVKIKVNVVAD